MENQLEGKTIMWHCILCERWHAGACPRRKPGKLAVTTALIQRGLIPPIRTEWKRCPACGCHSDIVISVGICRVCDGE